MKLLIILLFLSQIISVPVNKTTPAPQSIKLIAHRGGVVNQFTPENSMEALVKAVHNDYWMVEIDLRATKDKVLITNHDSNLKRYFNLNKNIDETTWEEISQLESINGTKVQKFEDILKLCSCLGINVMIDMKIKGFDKNLCQSIIDLLDKYNLREEALMIGSSATTEFFTGKIKLSCTKKQLLENMKRPDYSPDNYYYFGNPTLEDREWAKRNNIMVVGVINTWAIDSKKEEQIVTETVLSLKNMNVEYVQIDSKYQKYFE